MPFTPAHAAIVLPFLKHRWLSGTALIAGSIAPDFEYFFRLHRNTEFSHTIPGIFLFNLPVALLLSVVFHVLVRDVVIHHLPLYLKRRALTIKYPDWIEYMRQHWFLISVSCIIGAFSHWAWDGFTYDKGFFVRQLPILMTEVRLPVIDYTIRLCRIVQHLSTILGLLVIFWHVHRLPVTKAAKPIKKQSVVKFWAGIFGFGVMFLCLNLVLRLYIFDILSSIVVTLISGWLLALLLASAVVKLRQQL